MIHSYNIHRSEWYIYITLQIKMIHAYDIHRSQWKTHIIFIDSNDTHFLKSFTSLFGKGGWKPELICPNIMLQHPDSNVVAAAAPLPPAPPRAVMLTVPVSLAMAKWLPQWPSVWANKSFVRGAVNRKKQCRMENSGKRLPKLTLYLLICHQRSVWVFRDNIL